MKSHRTDRIFATEKDAIQVRPMYSVPVLQARVLRVVRDDSCLKASNASVVDQNIEAAVFLQNQ